VARVIGKDVIEAKLAAAEANILAHNLMMTREMLEQVKAEVAPQIPLGPGHFGYHTRDTLVVDVKAGSGQLGTKVTGVLKAAMPAYWREKGTKRGEEAHWTARNALRAVRKVIDFYYGKSGWWHV
jgi:hypothetical protein